MTDFRPAFIGNQNAILNCGAPTDAFVIEAFWGWTQMVCSTQTDTEKKRFSLGIKKQFFYNKNNAGRIQFY